MKKNSMNTVVRILIVVCGIALFAVNFLPIWRIDLDAPQYPEGLRMLIYANKLEEMLKSLMVLIITSE